MKRMTKKLKKMGYRSRGKVLVGHADDVLDKEAQSDDNDLVVLIKRRAGKAGMEKHMTEAFSVASKYPGKVMIIRRQD